MALVTLAVFGIGAGAVALAVAGRAAARIACSTKKRLDHSDEPVEITDLSIGTHISHTSNELPFRHAIVIELLQGSDGKTDKVKLVYCRKEKRKRLVEVRDVEVAEMSNLCKHEYEYLVSYSKHEVAERAKSLTTEYQREDGHRVVVESYWPFFDDDEHFADWCHVGLKFTDALRAVVLLNNSACATDVRCLSVGNHIKTEGGTHGIIVDIDYENSQLVVAAYVDRRGFRKLSISLAETGVCKLTHVPRKTDARCLKVGDNIETNDGTAGIIASIDYENSQLELVVGLSDSEDQNGFKTLKINLAEIGVCRLTIVPRGTDARCLKVGDHIKTEDGTAGIIVDIDYKKSQLEMVVPSSEYRNRPERLQINLTDTSKLTLMDRRTDARLLKAGDRIKTEDGTTGVILNTDSEKSQVELVPSGSEDTSGPKKQSVSLAETGVYKLAMIPRGTDARCLQLGDHVETKSGSTGIIVDIDYEKTVFELSIYPPKHGSRCEKLNLKDIKELTRIPRRTAIRRMKVGDHIKTEDGTIGIIVDINYKKSQLALIVPPPKGSHHPQKLHVELTGTSIITHIPGGTEENCLKVGDYIKTQDGTSGIIVKIDYKKAQLQLMLDSRRREKLRVNLTDTSKFTRMQRGTDESCVKVGDHIKTEDGTTGIIVDGDRKKSELELVVFPLEDRHCPDKIHLRSASKLTGKTKRTDAHPLKVGDRIKADDGTTGLITAMNKSMSQVDLISIPSEDHSGSEMVRVILANKLTRLDYDVAIGRNGESVKEVALRETTEPTYPRPYVNSEQFAMWCRTSTTVSPQVASTLARGRLIGRAWVWVTTLDSVHTGDHIAFNSGKVYYYQHAVVTHVVGDHADVIYLQGNASESDHSKRTVKRDRIDLAHYIKKEQVCRYFHGIKEFYDSKEVVDRAESHLDRHRDQLPFKNAEHFANWCKTGLYQLHVNAECNYLPECVETCDAHSSYL